MGNMRNTTLDPNRVAANRTVNAILNPAGEMAEGTVSSVPKGATSSKGWDMGPEANYRTGNTGNVTLDPNGEASDGTVIIILDSFGETTKGTVINISNQAGERTKRTERTGINISNPARETAKRTGIAGMVPSGKMDKGMANAI